MAAHLANTTAETYLADRAERKQHNASNHRQMALTTQINTLEHPPRRTWRPNAQPSKTNPAFSTENTDNPHHPPNSHNSPPNTEPHVPHSPKPRARAKQAAPNPSSPLLNTLRQQEATLERELKERATKYRNNHPKMQAGTSRVKTSFQTKNRHRTCTHHHQRQTRRNLGRNAHSQP